MKYMFVVQFPEEKYGDFDWIEKIENKLEESLVVDAELDGNDIGSGELNFFIYTNNPQGTFEIVKNIFKEEGSALEDAKIAYRNMDGDEYFCLWPEGLTNFEVL